MMQQNESSNSTRISFELIVFVVLLFVLIFTGLQLSETEAKLDDAKREITLLNDKVTARDNNTQDRLRSNLEELATLVGVSKYNQSDDSVVLVDQIAHTYKGNNYRKELYEEFKRKGLAMVVVKGKDINLTPVEDYPMATFTLNGEPIDGTYGGSVGMLPGTLKMVKIMGAQTATLDIKIYPGDWVEYDIDTNMFSSRDIDGMDIDTIIEVVSGLRPQPQVYFNCFPDHGVYCREDEGALAVLARLGFEEALDTVTNSDFVPGAHVYTFAGTDLQLSGLYYQLGSVGLEWSDADWDAPGIREAYVYKSLRSHVDLHIGENQNLPGFYFLTLETGKRPFLQAEPWSPIAVVTPDGDGKLTGGEIILFRISRKFSEDGEMHLDKGLFPMNKAVSPSRLKGG